MPFDTSVTRRWIEAAVVVGIVVMSLAVLLPAIQWAREAARRTESKNNLKQLGLALHNYHDVFRCFPPGGTFSADGRGYHGWLTSIWPQLEGGSFYNLVEIKQAWDAPDNAGIFVPQWPLLINPSIRDDTTPSTFAVSHYSANSHLLAANSAVRFLEIEDPANVFFVGELGGDFIPRGCPYNWRPLTGSDAAPQTYGRSGIGGQFMMVDGSVRWVGAAVSEDVLSALRGPDLARAAGADLKIARPKSFPVPPDALIPERIYHAGLACLARQNLQGQLVELSTMPDGKELSRDARDTDLAWIGGFPYLVRLHATGEFTDEGAQYLASLSGVEALHLSNTDKMSDGAFAFLANMPKLKSLSLTRRRLTRQFIEHVRPLSKLENLQLRLAEVDQDTPELIGTLPKQVTISLQRPPRPIE